MNQSHSSKPTGKPLFKGIALLLLITMGFLLLAGCGTASAPVSPAPTEAAPGADNAADTGKNQGPEAPVEALKVRVAAPAGAPTLSMIRMFQEQPNFGPGVSVTYESVKSPDLMAARILSGEIDIAVVPTNLAATLYNRGAKFTLAAASVWGVLYVVGNEPIDSWEDLRGQEIYTLGRGLTPDIVFRHLLQRHGLDPETDVTLNYVGEVAELASSFIAGKSSVSVIPEPALSHVMLKKPETLVLLDLQQEWEALHPGLKGYPQASLIISNRLIENHPDFVHAFLAEYEAAILWLSGNAATAGEYSEALETGLSKAAVINGLERSNIRFQPAQEAKAAIKAYLEVLLRYSPEAIGGGLPDETFFLQ